MGGQDIPLRTDYETVAAAQADQVLGPAGRQGDILERIVATCTGAGVTNTVSIKDGAAGAVIPIVPANAPAGVYTVEIRARAVSDGWRLTTAATVTVLAVGRFS